MRVATSPVRTRTALTGVAALGLLLIAPACAGPDADAPSAAAPPGLQPLATFGCGECDGPELLGRTGVTVGPSGRVYVTDSAEPYLRVVGADGNLELALGTRGEAEGEIRLPILLGVLEDPSGGFWVQEAMFLHHFDDDGTPLETRPYRGGLPLGYGYDHARGQIFMVRAPMPGTAAPDTPRRALVRIDPRLEEPVEVAPWGQVIGEEVDVEADRSGRGLAVASDGNLALIDTWEYRIRVIDPSGALVREFGRSGLPRALKEGRELEQARSFSESTGTPLETEKPHLGPWAAFDGAGRLWLTTRRDAALLDVFDAAGGFLGEVVLPAPLDMNFSALGISGDRLAAVVSEPDGSTRVWLYRIVTS